MTQAADQPAKPIRTWRPMALWTAGILLALGLAWFVGAAVVPYFQVRAFMAKGRSPGPEQIRRLGGPEVAARRIVRYLRLPKAIAPRNYGNAWELAAAFQKLSQHGVPCLIQVLKEDEAGVRRVAAYELGQLLLDSVQQAETEEAETDIEPRVFNEGILALAGALQDGDRVVRSVTAAELGFIGPRAAAAIPGLERLLRDSGSDEEMRQMALGSLGQIRDEKPGK